MGPGPGETRPESQAVRIAGHAVEKGNQADCKPGSVVRPRQGAEGGRWPFIWDARCRAPRAINPGGGVRKRASWNHVPPLLDLAPGGVCRAVCVAAAAVRSCRTLSPLPPALRPVAVCFLWHFPWGHPRRALPGAMFPWSPDFPPFPKGGRAAIRPSDSRFEGIARRRHAVNAPRRRAPGDGPWSRHPPHRRPAPGESGAGRR